MEVAQPLISEGPIVQKLLAGEFKEGDHILVDADPEGVLRFQKQEAGEPVAV
jgi:hypothetical protein